MIHLIQTLFHTLAMTVGTHDPTMKVRSFLSGD